MARLSRRPTVVNMWPDRFNYAKKSGVKNDHTKVGKVMGEYKRGTLKSSSGHKVKSRKQAVAIAMSESRKGY